MALITAIFKAILFKAVVNTGNAFSLTN